MGWNSGSEIAERVWKVAKKYIKAKDYKAVSKKIYEIFEEYDADDWSYYLQEKDSLFYTYLKLNDPEQFEELQEEVIGS